MGRGVSSGGGQSSLGYLFGSGEPPKASPAKAEASPREVKVASKEPSPKPNVIPPVVEVSKQVAAGIHSSTNNNHGQNTCNYITDRPSTKVHAAPGGGSSLDYLFGGGSK